MFQFQGIWLPDGEKHFPEWMAKNGELVNGKGTYQIKKLREAIKWCKQFRTAVDVGCHCGLWSQHLVGRFLALHAFEPIPQFRECFVKNVPAGYTLHECAIGNKSGNIFLSVNPLDTGDTHVTDQNTLQTHKQIGAPIELLDSFCLQDVDFIKIDCEGYELQVLQGAAETIARCKPCIIVEQKQHKMEKNFGTKGTPAVDWLKERGAILRREMGGDYIMSFE